jgi:hypothetical protein
MANYPNLNILTYGSKVSYVTQEYYTPASTITATGQPVSTFYAFLSKVDPWPIDPISNLEIPPQPTQDQSYIKNVFKNIFFSKQITPAQMSPVIQRIDWTSGNTYDYYQDNIDMFQVDQNGLLVKQFYVRNTYNQVFKCLWNNNGGQSTMMPFFQPGNYGTNNIFSGGGDGYKWKYIYTIANGDQLNFMDSTWMPVKVPQQIINPLSSNPGSGLVAGSGDIEVINVINGGSGFTSSNVISVQIIGDGTASNGAVGTSATAVVTPSQLSGGSITDITITDPGANYTYANVVITSASGNNVTVVAPVSPVGGHGFDPISELGCKYIMMSVQFNQSENGFLPTNIDYRQVGILVNPIASSTFPNAANATTYNTTTQISVANGPGSYQNDEVVQQVDPVTGQVVFSATVLTSTYIINTTVQVINITGTPITNLGLIGQTSGCARTLIGVNSPDFIPFSGYIAYIENRAGVTRSPDGIEQFKFVLGY